MRSAGIEEWLSEVISTVAGAESSALEKDLFAFFAHFCGQYNEYMM